MRVPRRTQLPPDSPSLSFDAIPSPSRTVRNARRTPHGAGTSLSQTQLNSPSDNDLTPRGHEDNDATPRTRSRMLASGRAGTGSPLSSVQRRAEVRSSRREALFAGSDEVVMEEEGSVDITVSQGLVDDSQPVRRNRGPAQVDEEDEDDGVPDTFEDAEDNMGPGVGDFGNGENDFDDSFSVEDTGLEEAAVAAEQDDDEDDEQSVSPPPPKKRGRPSKDSTSSAKRQRHAPTPPSSRAKPKRVSGFPRESCSHARSLHA